jgi:hypothetical protein
MVNLEIPWINVLSKMDLVTPDPDDPTRGARNGLRRRKNVARYLDPDPLLLSAPLGQVDEGKGRNPAFHALNEAIVQLVRYFFLVSAHAC